MKNKLLLNQARYITDGSSNTTVPLVLPSNKDIIVDDNFSEIINEYSVYESEREACNTIRLTASVNLVASNIIFNSVTEIVKDEGSSGCTCLNYEPKTIASTLGSKSTSYEWGKSISDCTMDTQITSDLFSDKNYKYLCGIDIFNNHILRSRTVYGSWNTVCKEDEEFNTLKEILGDANHERGDICSKSDVAFGNHVTRSGGASNTVRGGGVQALGFTGGGSSAGRAGDGGTSRSEATEGRWNGDNSGDQNVNTKAVPLKRYTKDSVYGFYESLILNLKDVNGWVGFYNKTQTSLYSNGTNRVINNESPNKFIDLFPDRERYTLKNHYNKYRDRYEKNWEYCLTYPYSSTTEHVPFINSELDTLNILFIDENTIADDGVYRCIIYTISKHGLFVGDKINLYRSSEDNTRHELIEDNLVVEDVFDDYSFSVYTSDWVCRTWVSVFDENYEIEHIVGNKYSVSGNLEYSSSDYVNLDYDTEENIGSKNLSFAKVSNNIQCKYYVRIFSRFPNFDSFDKNVTYNNIYTPENGVRPVDKYAKAQYSKQSTFSKLAYSKNIYGDDIFQIVYNDDIEIDVLKDNLGRPLTNLYISFFKTNYGYKKWYNNNNGGIPDYKNSSVEWSRCFGKLNCGFEYSPYISFLETSFEKNKLYGDIHIMNNVKKHEINGMVEMSNGGLNQNWLGGGNSNATIHSNDDYDEIFYNEQHLFYGDLCCYSPYDCTETLIQTCYHRFNTAQRELIGTINSTQAYTTVKYDDLDGIINTFDTKPNAQPEGCVYQTNYEIPIRSFSTNVFEFRPDFINIVKIENTDEENVYIITTSIENYVDMDINITFFDSLEENKYDCEVINIFDLNIIKLKIIGFIYDTSDDINRYKIFKTGVNIPDYAEVIREPDLVYRWREIVQNGFEESEGIVPEYPFVNGCLYVHKNINIFLRRQDPFGEYGLSTESAYYGTPILMGVENDIENGTANNIIDAFREGEVSC